MAGQVCFFVIEVIQLTGSAFGNGKYLVCLISLFQKRISTKGVFLLKTDECVTKYMACVHNLHLFDISFHLSLELTNYFLIRHYLPAWVARSSWNKSTSPCFLRVVELVDRWRNEFYHVIFLNRRGVASQCWFINPLNCLKVVPLN